MHSKTMRSSLSEWERSGARDLTAHRGAPPGDPAERLVGVAESIAELSHGAAMVDGPGQLTIRAHLSTLSPTPRPQFTLRGAGKMMRTADGWVAVHLPRESDRELIPALTHGELVACADPTADPTALDALEQWMLQITGHELLSRAVLLDLPINPIPKTLEPTHDQLPWHVSALESVGPRRAPLRVCDLSTLWAGPLAGALLAQTGAQVMKLESTTRPERPLASDREFVEYLNGAKQHTAINFENLPLLHSYVESADVVITSARQRALENLGLRPKPGQIWLRITAFGSSGAEALRIGFGDDVAASAGAVAWHEGQPSFCADALADPISGLLGTQAVFELLDASMSGVIDVSLFQAAKWAIHSEEAAS